MNASPTVKLFFQCVFLSCCLAQTTIHIPEDAATITEAWGMLTNGGAIEIADGTTLTGTGNCAIELDSTRGTPLLISGENSQRVVLDCAGSGYGIHIIESQTGTPLIFNLAQLTIQNTNGPAFVLSAPRTEIDLDRVFFVNNHATTNDGISNGRGGAIFVNVVGGESSLIDCSSANFTNNQADVQGGAIYLNNARSASTWAAVVFQENSAPEGMDIYCEKSENVILQVEEFTDPPSDNTIVCGAECNLGILSQTDEFNCGNPDFGTDDGGSSIRVSASILTIAVIVMISFFR